MIIAVAGQKGGSGKTIISTCLAAEAMRLKRSVLFVDADPQGTATEWIHDADKSGNPAPKLVQLGADMHEPHLLPKMYENFDFAIIDGPPRLYEVQLSIFMVANIVILPCAPSKPDFRALAKMFPHIEKAKELRPTLNISVVLNRIKTVSRGKEASAALSESGIDVMKIGLGDRLDFQDAYQAGLGVSTYAPNSKAAHEIQSLYKEILRKAK